MRVQNDGVISEKVQPDLAYHHMRFKLYSYFTVLWTSTGEFADFSKVLDGVTLRALLGVTVGRHVNSPAQ